MKKPQKSGIFEGYQNLKILKSKDFCLSEILEISEHCQEYKTLEVIKNPEDF